MTNEHDPEECSERIELHRTRTPQRTRTDESDGDDRKLTAQFRLPRGTWRRFRFEPRADGPGWWRFEDEWTGCTWRPIGREVVEDVSFSTDADH